MTTSTSGAAYIASNAASTAPYAPWGSRVLSALIDNVVALVPLLVYLGYLAVTRTDGSTSAGVLQQVAYVLCIAIWVWQMYEQGTKGQTIGKKVAGTRLVRVSDGQPVGFLRSVLRNILHIVDQLPFLLGYLWPLWDRKRQTFADKIVKSVVIRHAG